MHWVKDNMHLVEEEEGSREIAEDKDNSPEMVHRDSDYNLEDMQRVHNRTNLEER